MKKKAPIVVMTIIVAICLMLFVGSSLAAATNTGPTEENGIVSLAIASENANYDVLITWGNNTSLFYSYDIISDRPLQTIDYFYVNKKITAGAAHYVFKTAAIAKIISVAQMTQLKT